MRLPPLRVLLPLLLPILVAVFAALFLKSATSDAVGALGLVALVGVGVSFYAGSGNAPKLAGLRDTARAAARGELDRAFPADGDDAYGELGGYLEEMRKAVRGQLRDLGEQSDAQARHIDDLTHSIDELRGTVTGQLSAVEETAALLHEMTSSLKQIAHSVETLASAAEESSSSILEMAAANDEVSANMVTLASSVQESATSIEEMTFSIKEVAKNVEALSSTAEETSSSMSEMDISIRQVENNANETARLSEEVSRAASSGGEAIQHTIDGINKIKDSSLDAVKVISSLGTKIGEIGKILNVIDDVAEQTNLLALNAAIIAAQAGEHGKGFAVVADEIKDLAERAGASTKEIAELIKGVQGESKNAIDAVERGARSVDASFFLAPLPPAGPLTVVCAWPAWGIAETTTVLDGDEIHAAAREVQVLWPLEPEDFSVPEPAPLPDLPAGSWFARALGAG